MLLGVAVGAAAVICCAGRLAITGVLRGLALSAALGVAGGILAIAAAAGGAVVLIRTRQSHILCDAFKRSSNR